jgi:Fe-S-cluster-containing hydrogenase component 2
MPKYNIFTAPENCSFCRRCQLACSQAYRREFNPSSAQIRIDVNDVDCTITFQESCRQCGICVEHCLFGALHKTAQEAA